MVGAKSIPAKVPELNWICEVRIVMWTFLWVYWICHLKFLTTWRRISHSDHVVCSLMTPSGTAENYINRAAVCGQTNKQFTPFITSFGPCRQIEYYYRITYIRIRLQSGKVSLLSTGSYIWQLKTTFITYRRGQNDGISMWVFNSTI